MFGALSQLLHHALLTRNFPNRPLPALCGRFDSPAGDGDFYFGGGDVAGDRVEVVHR